MTADIGTRRIGVFGGTFDPPHLGHLVVASEVYSQFLLDEVVFVPAGDPWQKRDVEASASQRRDMTELAVANNPAFRVSSVDIVRGGPTYMFDTLSDIARENPGAELICILGSDAVAGMPTWHAADRLSDLARFVGVARPGEPANQPGIEGLTVEFTQVPLIEISSTDIRHRIKQGKPIRYLVSDAVAEFIEAHNLYGRDT